MDLTKEALKYLAEQGINPKERVVSINNQSYVIDENGNPQYIALRYLAENALKINTLSGLVDYIKSNLDRTDEKLYLHIASHKSVHLVSTLKPDGRREELAIAEAILPDFWFDRFYDMEEFNVALQSIFVKNPDREILLKVVGNLKEDNVKTTGDDGVSQAVTIKTGVASAAEIFDKKIEEAKTAINESCSISYEKGKKDGKEEIIQKFEEKHHVRGTSK